MWPPHPAGMRPRGSRRATIVRPPRIGRCGSGSDGVSGWDGRPPRLRQLKSVRNSRFSGRLPPEGHPVTHCSPADRTWEGFMNLIPEALRGYQRAWLTRDVVAGLTLSAVAIPEVMGYTSIAQTSIVTGLYTVIFPALIFALLGSSRLLVVGADSATAAVLAAGLTGLGLAGVTPGSSAWLAFAGLTALVCGGLLFVARLLRL